MIAVDSSVVIELLSGAAHAEAVEHALRDSLAQGPVVLCDVVLAEVCSSLRQGDQALAALEEVGIAYSTVEPAAALRAGEMQRRYRSRGGVRRLRTVPDFIIGAHALLQCRALITRDDGFFRDYFKGLKVIVPSSA